MRIIITCGPSYEPLDQVRRLTNFSTGRLGATLANHFARQGHEVFCLKGENATCQEPVRAASMETFTTNDDLAQRLLGLSRLQNFDAVFHAAALCDYKVSEVLNGASEPVQSPKFATADGALHLRLRPATKVLPLLRAWFPAARLVGWKYELAGTREEAFLKASRQLRQCRTNACVLNGAAYGPGFAFCPRVGTIRTCPDSLHLCEVLEEWLAAPTAARDARLEMATA